MGTINLVGVQFYWTIKKEYLLDLVSDWVCVCLCVFVYACVCVVCVFVCMCVVCGDVCESMCKWSQ